MKTIFLNQYHFFKSCIEARVKNFIFSSTAAVYGISKNQTSIKENSTKDPKSPYGMSKLIFEDILKQVAEKHNLKTVIFRYFNVAGADKD